MNGLLCTTNPLFDAMGTDRQRFLVAWHNWLRVAQPTAEEAEQERAALLSALDQLAALTVRGNANA